LKIISLTCPENVSTTKSGGNPNRNHLNKHPQSHFVTPSLE